MHQHIHANFSNLSAKQEFALDDVINELTRLRDSSVKEMDIRTAAVHQTVAKGKAVHQYLGSYDIFERIVQYHNALVVATKMRENGETKIPLNPTKSLADQIIAMADKASGIGIFEREAAQKRLNPPVLKP